MANARPQEIRESQTIRSYSSIYVTIVNRSVSPRPAVIAGPMLNAATPRKPGRGCRTFDRAVMPPNWLNWVEVKIVKVPPAELKCFVN